MSERYLRHRVLPGVGELGQSRFQKATVRIHGDGKAAEEAAFYLVAAGVGRVILAPSLKDRILERLSELNPEVLFGDSALFPFEVRPESPDRRADGSLAALLALLEIAEIKESPSWEHRSFR